ncbi:TonB-dependent receptor [Chryseolinea soli]|uniref:TonB-dependent receptor n=1 Tax=Chryseolinea soli TaxID=2321403 RepID=A0A385T1T6_9BACT|nr:TonB-dependent receptor [Chryseolinea soli]AYB35088.1 TonB-dependent receptor [Chryseolinea soli]
MKIVFCFLVLIVAVFSSYGQTKISGSVTAISGEVIPGASIYIFNSLDGTSSDAEGKFSFTTDETGDKILVVSAIGFVKQEIPLVLDGALSPFAFKLKEEEAAQLNEVVISAGSMEANSDREVAVLKPMDIYTNAGAAGDIVGAIQTLPGTQRVAEQTGLFVRGGDASESAVIIDGMTVQNAFFSNVPGVAQRSRFTPFQFKGMSFSSGGYSVRYGQALSSILELNTLDLPEKTTVSANVNMAGVALSGIKRWKRSAGEVTANYSNLSPFYKIANTNFNFYDVPTGGGASAKWSAQNEKGGIFKAFVKHDYYQSGTEIPDPYQPGNMTQFGLKNQNTYFNASFRQLINGKTLVYTALSASVNEDKTQWGVFPIVNNDWRMQWRGEVTQFLTEAFNVTLGSEVQRYQYKQNFDTAAYHFDETQVAMYLESEWKPGKQWAFKPGVRVEYSKLLQKGNIAPRIAMAVKTGNYSQVSLASGIFYQLADKRYLLRDYQPDFQQAVHYMANYQWINDSRSFRIEGYYKSYNQLVRELNATYNPNPYRVVSGAVDNFGSGYAQGVDVFWRDQKTIKNFDYWLAYSYVDTKRLYANFIGKATPDFVSNHNVNITTKYFIESLQVNLGATFSFTSGRPYYNPLDQTFLGSRSPSYRNLSLNLSYLTSIGKWFTVFYANVDNVLNYKNVLGYRYSADGQSRYEILPPLYRAVFVGVNISLTSFKKDEL